MTISEDPGGPTRKTATLGAAFSESMGAANMVMQAWNAGDQITGMRVFGALVVTVPVDPEPKAGIVYPGSTAMHDAVDPGSTAGPDFTERDMLAMRMRSGLEPESMTYGQMLASPGPDCQGDDMLGWW